MSPPVPVFAAFATLEDAKDFRFIHGGHLFLVDDGSAAYWFPFTLTAPAVLTHPALRGLNGTLNPL